MGIAYGLGWVTAAELDGLGMTAAVALAMGRAYEALPGLVRQATGSVIIDGAINYLPDVEGSKAVIKADGSVACVSAASILAKVARDSWMAQAAEQFPGYGFEKHVGYGTRQHMEGLAAHGVCTLHRRSFKPVARYIEGSGAAT
jgi:ribonuclease HII